MNKTSNITFKVSIEQKDKALNIIQNRLHLTLQEYFQAKVVELIDYYEK